MAGITEWFHSHQNTQAVAILAGFVVGALLIELLIRRVATKLTASTKNDLDDEIVKRIRHPMATSVVLVGVHFAIETLYDSELVVTVADATLVTFGVVLWTFAALRIAEAVARRTKTDVDDEVLKLVRVPLAATVVLVGLRVVVSTMELSDGVRFVGHACLVTAGVVLWTRAATRVGITLLEAMVKKGSKFRLIETRTLPLFRIVLQTVVYLGAAYAICLAWHVDVTAWLASAGIVGIAVGFAAKDTLANLFAGIFIIADAPYKVDDFIILDSGERGRVTNIGIRSTRLLTRDDVEVTIPNAALGNAKIVNETGGPHELERVRVNIGVAYGSDLDKVREVLMDVAAQSQYLNKEERFTPRVRFRTFGDSSLDFQLMGWIDEPVLRGRALDELNCAVYKRFGEEGIEIPFPQRDMWIKSMPSDRQG